MGPDLDKHIRSAVVQIVIILIPDMKILLTNPERTVEEHRTFLR